MMLRMLGDAKLQVETVLANLERERSVWKLKGLKGSRMCLSVDGPVHKCRQVEDIRAVGQHQRGQAAVGVAAMRLVARLASNAALVCLPSMVHNARFTVLPRHYV